MLLAVANPKLEAISRVPLFAHLSKREREFIAKEGDEVNVPAGKTLTRQDRSGEAEVKVDGKRRRVLRPGDFFGEISMLDRGAATATVTTLTDARLFVMSHAQFRDAIKSSDQLMLKVLKAMGERLREDLAAKR